MTISAGCSDGIGGRLPDRRQTEYQLWSGQRSFYDPVPVGNDVRIEVERVEATAKKGDPYPINTRNTVNNNGGDKSALIAEQLILAMA